MEGGERPPAPPCRGYINPLAGAAVTAQPSSVTRVTEMLRSLNSNRTEEGEEQGGAGSHSRRSSGGDSGLGNLDSDPDTAETPAPGEKYNQCDDQMQPLKV